MAPRRNTEWVYIKGKCGGSRPGAYTMLPPGPPDMGFGGGTPRYKIVIYPIPDDNEVLRNLQKEGMKNLEKRDEDGSYWTFSRPTAIMTAGKTIGLEPPTIVDKDGKTFFDQVGKGSDITIKLEVYKHKLPGKPDGAKAARLASVRIDNLVPFQNEIDLTDRQQKAIQGLTEQPKPNYNF